MTDQTEARPLRLLVVDDHEVVRQGLVSLLERREHFQVVAEAGTAAEAVEMTRKFEPDLVVMDVRLPDGSGIEACREIRAEFPGTRVVILTSYPDEEAVLSAIIAGASGYLLKQIRGRDLISALESVGRGESLLDPAVTEKVLDRVRRIATGTYTDELAQLTQQEQKILLLVAEGKTNKEIASEVFLSDKTVKNYVSSILSKLNLERRAQAAAFVARHRLTGGACGAAPPHRGRRPDRRRRDSESSNRPSHGCSLTVHSPACVSSAPMRRSPSSNQAIRSSCTALLPRRPCFSTPWCVELPSSRTSRSFTCMPRAHTLTLAPAWRATSSTGPCSSGRTLERRSTRAGPSSSRSSCRTFRA
jgi:DNA-binding NarL/FixJ family response regulator